MAAIPRVVGVRHAQVENPGGIVYGRLGGFGLSDSGLKSAERVSAALASLPVSAVFAGPLERAQQTAAAIAARHGLPVVTDERLTEWSFWSRWEGMEWERIRELDPELLDSFAADPGSVNPEDPLFEAGRRVLDWAREADSTFDGAPDSLVIGVSHEAPLAAALLVGAGRGLEEFASTSVPHLGGVRLVPAPAEPVDLANLA